MYKKNQKQKNNGLENLRTIQKKVIQNNRVKVVPNQMRDETVIVISQNDLQKMQKEIENYRGYLRNVFG